MRLFLHYATCTFACILHIISIINIIVVCVTSSRRQSHWVLVDFFYTKSLTLALVTNLLRSQGLNNLLLNAELFKDALNEYAYSAELAGLKYNLKNSVYGVQVKQWMVIKWTECRLHRLFLILLIHNSCWYECKIMWVHSLDIEAT